MRTTLIVAILASCSHDYHPFPLREPLLKDNDMNPVSVRCRPEPSKEDPDGRKLEWDGIDVFPFRDGLIARKDVYSTSGSARVLGS